MTKQLMPRLPAGNYIPHVPEPPQVAFLLTDRLIAKPLEVMFGGAAGGGKNSKISPSKYREIKASNIADTSTEVRPDTLAAMEKKWKEEGHREAEVLTPHGFVPLGDLRPGMQVCNPDGTVSKIRAIHLPGVQQMYRITMADGSSTVAGAEHLWTYRAARTRKRRKASAAKDYFDIPLDTLPHGVQRWAMDLQTKFTICDTVELKKRVDGGAESILLPQCRPQRLASKRGKWPHLSPYITGALLGDGSVTQGGVFFCSDDAEIVDRVAEELPPHLELRKHANQEGRPESWWQGGIVVRPEFQDSTLSRGDKNEGRGSGSVGGLRETAQRILERDGVFGKGAAEKFIPRWCKEGSLEDRWGVIQGLMDTDGYADDRGHCQFVSISERLALDVQWVCRSLGFRATLTSKIPTYQHDGETKEGQRAYLVQIAGNDLGRLFHLRRKKERCRTDWNGNNISDAHRVISVEPEDEMTAMCISVDHPNGLYVTDDFIVTHNSDALLMAALQYALGMDTPIPTPNGWSTIADLRIGDQVFSETGDPITVIAKSPVFETGERYRVTFDDGVSVDADGDHLWKAETFADRLSLGRGLSLPSRLVTTREMARTQKTNHKKAAQNWSVMMPGALNLPEMPLPIPPYLLGVWLGDGSKRDGTIANLRDHEIREEIRALEWGELSAESDKTFYVKGLRSAVEALGIRNDKAIPAAYLRGSTKQRLALLQGLMDTDGTVDGRWGIPRFSNTNRNLIDGVAELARSLGWTPRIFEDSYGPKKTTIWTVTFLAEELVFRIPRKAERQKIGRERENARQRKWNIVRSVERLEDDSFPVQCITVDSPSHLYLAGENMMPTHNCDVPGYSALILRRTFNDLNEPGALMDRARKWLSKTDAKAVRGGREWDFPSGARLVFGHVQYHREAEEQFSGAEFQYIGIDELTRGWEERTYEFLLSRIRRPSETNSWRMQAAPDGTTLADVPLRMRSATNPGGSGHCLATATVLTPDRGWVDIREMKVGDSVFSLAEDGVMLETRVDQVHRHEFDGELIQVNARGLHMEFTPEHRIARVGGGRGKENWHKAFQLQTFDELPGQAVVLRSAIGGWKGTSFGASPDWFELVGIYLAEGSKMGKGQFTLAQKNPEGRLHISDLLDRLGISHSTASDEQITFSKGSVDGYFDRFGVSHEKYIPDELKAASVPQLQALLNGLMFDGHWQSEDGGTYYTSSQRLAEDFSEVALKCGYIVKMSERDRRGEAAGLNGRGQEIVHRHVSYEVAIKRTKSGGTEILTGNHLYDVGTETKRRSDVERVPYRGPVYCIGVPETHNFIVKQRGSVWVSGNSWVKRRFINEETKGNRIFIPSLLQDNPHLNQEEYEHALMQLDPVTRERLLRGDWDIVEAGAVFSRDTFQFQMEIPTGKDVKWARCWDFAATDAGAKDEPDFTVGALVGMGPDGKWYLADIQRVQMDTDKVERLVYNTAMADGRRVPIVIEQEPGSAGKVVISHFTRNILQGWEVHGDRPTGSKSERARPWAAAASSGNFFICSNPDNPKGWVPDFFNEVELFPTPRIHDDQVDAVSGAFNWLAENRRGGGLVL